MKDYSEISRLLKPLCAAGGVSGDEKEAASVAAELLGEYMPVEISPLGSVTGSLGESGTHILLDAHLDRIGLVVTSINKDGFLKVAKCGGVDLRTSAASEVTIFGKKKLFGVVTFVPRGLSKTEDSGDARDLDETAVDAGTSREEAEKLVSPGDKIIIRGEYAELLSGRARAAALDDRAGIAAVLRSLEILGGNTRGTRVSVTFSVGEETTANGAATSAFAASPDEAIGVDVSFAYAPGLDREKFASLGGGVMVGFAPSLDYAMSRRLYEIAERKNIPVQAEVMGGETGTDCDRIQTSGAGVKTALLSIPLRNMHTAAEICELSDIESAARLIAEYIKDRGERNA